MRGGMYGFTGPLAGTSAGAGWGGVANTANDSQTGAVKPEYAMPGGGRRRKGTRKSRKGGKSRMSRRRRTMRGGARYDNPASGGYGFTGTGSAGLANATGYSTHPQGGPQPGVNGVVPV
jgi:hypothetical protein